ncbi:hypothetical protein ACWDV4_11460 [Micromonospora sp. NPDC003197]
MAVPAAGGAFGRRLIEGGIPRSWLRWQGSLAAPVAGLPDPGRPRLARQLPVAKLQGDTLLTSRANSVPATMLVTASGRKGCW